MKKTSEDQKPEYNDILFRKLNNVKLPDALAHCQDVNCKEAVHSKAIDEYCPNLLECISESGHLTIPQYEPNDKNK